MKAQEKLNNLIKEYEKKFGDIENFIGREFPQITEELLQDALDNNEPIKPFDDNNGEYIF